jgi:hypothetical protein
MGAEISEEIPHEVYISNKLAKLPLWKQFIYRVRESPCSFVFSNRDIIFPELKEGAAYPDGARFMSEYTNLSDRGLFEKIRSLKFKNNNVPSYYRIDNYSPKIPSSRFEIHELNDSFEKEYPTESINAAKIKKLEEEVSTAKLKEYIASLEDKVKVLTEMVDEIQTNKEKKYELESLL